MKVPKIRKPRISELKKDLHLIYSWYVRLNGSKNGYNHCYTCGTAYPVLELQCGHYHSRKNGAITYDPMNTKPQCDNCNGPYGKGMPHEYARKLVEDYGPTVLDRLENMRKQTKKWTVDELMTKINEYKFSVSEILQVEKKAKVSARLLKFLER